MRPPTIDDIVQATATVYGVEPELIRRPTRKKEIIKLRHVAQYLCRRFTSQTLETIAGVVEGRTNHATVLHCYNKVAFEYETNLSMYNDITYLINRITERLIEDGFVLEDVIRSTDVAWYRGGSNYKTA